MKSVFNEGHICPVSALDTGAEKHSISSALITSCTIFVLSRYTQMNPLQRHHKFFLM